jgi:hypothetical protein
MNVFPLCDNKPLNECQRGQVVRPLVYGRNAAFGIVATIEDTEKLAVISFDEDGPTFAPISHPQQLQVLCYGDRCFLEVDHHGPFEGHARQLYEAKGAVIREQSRWLMNVWPERGGPSYDRAQFDISNARLGCVSHDISDIAVFGKWALYVGDRSARPDSWLLIAAFEWKPPARQGA